MAKYCTKCGKKLESGKECSCQVKENKKVIEEKGSNVVIDFLSKPFDTEIKNNNSYHSFKIIAAIALVIGFILNEINSLSHMDYYFMPVTYPYFRYFIIYSILAFATILFFNVLIQFLSKWILNIELSFYKLLDILAVSLLPIFYTSIISLIISWLFGGCYFLLNMIGFIFASIVYYHHITQLKEVNHNKFVYIFLSSLLLIMLLWI